MIFLVVIEFGARIDDRRRKNYTYSVGVGNLDDTMININLNAKYINVLLFVGVIDLPKKEGESASLRKIQSKRKAPRRHVSCTKDDTRRSFQHCSLLDSV